MKLIVRQSLLNKLHNLRGTPDIKVVTGIRRCGKSELLRSFLSSIKDTESNRTNILYIDLTDLDNEALKEYHALNSYIQERYDPHADNVLCVDEVQLCEGFELAINSIHSKGGWDIYLTGSNAFMLSSDLATLFTGRHIEIPVYPFSFKEYREYFGEKDVNDQFAEYVLSGGMAGSYLYSDYQARMDYNRSVYDTIVNRDLVQKRSISNVSSFNALSEFMMDNIGNLENANSISKVLKEDGKPSSHVTVGNHMGYLCDAFLFYKVKRYDIKGKRYLDTDDKYYLADQGFRWAVLGTRNMDYGRVYENIVAIELLRRGWSIYVGKLYQKEVDFVTIRASEKAYIQVCDDISGKDTLEREISPLLKIKDAYPKILLANTKHEEYDVQGVRVIDIARWLA